jgi:hypothetical protein
VTIWGRRDVLPVMALVVLLGSTLTACATAGSAEPVPRPWNAPLVTGGEDDVNVVAAAGGALSLTAAAGVVVLEPHELAAPANQVAVELTATIPPGAEVLVDIRGEREPGRWTEWVEARPGTPAALPEPTRQVQVRLLLSDADDGASPVLRSLRLLPALNPELPRLTGPVGTYRVFATRIGLVGNSTANWHVVQPSDHFVALPSRRTLSSRGSSEYTVQVCADNGRCAWAPVWDIGPWNTTDDYWNLPAVRESWRDLPQGLPQAQAAFQDGYNGGRDQFDRRVKNPAGIDLADGTFYDTLRLRDNEWVTVNYLWAGAGLFGLVGALPLTVHEAPSGDALDVGRAAEGAMVPLQCRAAGDWLRIGPGQYVPAAGLEKVPALPAC